MTNDVLISSVGSQAAFFERMQCLSHGPVTIRETIQGKDIFYGCAITFHDGRKVRYGWRIVTPAPGDQRTDRSDVLQPFEEWE